MRMTPALSLTALFNGRCAVAFPWSLTQSSRSWKTATSGLLLSLLPCSGGSGFFQECHRHSVHFPCRPRLLPPSRSSQPGQLEGVCLLLSLSSPPDKPDIKIPMANEANPCPCDIGHKLQYGGMGQEVQVEHIKAYVTRSPVDAGKAVIVVQDIFGWQLPNTRYMADMIAGNGYTTIVPDFFVGQEPWDPAGDWSTFPEWLKSRNARKVNREVDAVLRYLKQQCHAQKIGIVGFCWGGGVVHQVMMTYPEVNAGVSVYGIIRDAEDVYNLKNPTLFIFAENDAVIPLEQVSVLTQKLKEHCIVNYQVKTFSGQTHGFVHRKREDCSPADKPYIEEARRNLIEWLNKYI